MDRFVVVCPHCGLFQRHVTAFGVAILADGDHRLLKVYGQREYDWLVGKVFDEADETVGA